MQKYLALIALPAATLCHAQAPAAPVQQPHAGIQQVGAQRPIPANSGAASAPRQLTVEQRAELRRQLSQQSRLPGKGS